MQLLFLAWKEDLTLSYSYKRLFISSEGFSTLEKNAPYNMLPEGNAAHPVGCDSPLLTIMAEKVLRGLISRPILDLGFFS